MDGGARRAERFYFYHVRAHAMTEVSEGQIEEIAAVVESDPSDVDDDGVSALLDGIVHSKYDIYSPASDAFTELVEGLSDEEIADRFDADRLRGRLTIDQYNAGKALTAVLGTLAETDPEAIRELQPEIRAGLGAYLQESETKEVLCDVLPIDELVEEARALMNAENSTARNVGVRIVTEVVGRGYDVEETDPDAVEPALPDVWEVLKNPRENSKPRENAASALATHAEARPDAYTDRMDEIAEVFRTTESKIRYDLFDIPQAVAAHNPDAVAPLAPTARREFTDITATGSTKGAAIELLAAIVDTHPDVISSLDPFVEYVEDDTNRYDEEAAGVVAAVGEPEHAGTLLGAGKFTPGLIAILVEGLDDEGRAAVGDTVREAVEDDDPEIRVRALATVSQVFHGEFDDPAAVYLERLDDTEGDGYDTVREKAAQGLRTVAAEDPGRLSGAVDRLFEAAEAAHDADDYSFRTLIEVLAELVVADDDVYARVVDNVESDDDTTQYVAIQVLSDATTAYPPGLPDPVPALVDLHGGDDEREYGLDGSIRDALGGLVYARPDALDSVIDRAIEWYRTDEEGTSYRLVTDLAPEYPEVPVALVEELAEYYTDRYAGEYPYDDTDVAIALAHAAMAEPDRVRSELTELLDAPADDRPGSLSLVLIGLGDHDTVPDGFADAEGWIATQFSSSGERRQLRLLRFLAAAGYEPAEPRLEALTTGAAESDIVTDAAAGALERRR